MQPVGVEPGGAEAAREVGVAGAEGHGYAEVVGLGGRVERIGCR
ncbi:MAG: hypothetical protein R3D59_16520 [Paracoccaceae bacterium]